METEIKWTNPDAEALFLELKRNIEATMALPPWAFRSPDAHQRAFAEAMEACEVMCREAAKLLTLYAIQEIWVSAEEAENITAPAAR